eukprot:TRINITY_DN7565_c0_g1_i1.p2 TRINITY_DN7565_c0_g1~~TRINITY_DN7565_c0_g1_i1.p2  ORF type:complete len:180 (-),score=78.45 TRINITY_DN7565_c0_g1_i1:67-606(-)
MFSTFDCLLVAARGTEDPWNSIGAGFSTGFVLAIRGGVTTALISGAMGGLILGLMEGISILLTKYLGGQMRAQQMMQHEEAMRQAQAQGEQIDTGEFDEFSASSFLESSSSALVGQLALAGLSSGSLGSSSLGSSSSMFVRGLNGLEVMSSSGSSLGLLGIGQQGVLKRSDVLGLGMGF